MYKGVKVPITTAAAAALLSSRLEIKSLGKTGSTDTSPSPEMQSHNLQLNRTRRGGGGRGGRGERARQ